MIKGKTKRPPKTRVRVPSPSPLSCVLLQWNTHWYGGTFNSPNNGIVRDGTGANLPLVKITCFLRAFIPSHTSQMPFLIPCVDTCKKRVESDNDIPYITKDT